MLIIIYIYIYIKKKYSRNRIQLNSVMPALYCKKFSWNDNRKTEFCSYYASCCREMLTFCEFFILSCFHSVVIFIFCCEFLFLFYCELLRLPATHKAFQFPFFFFFFTFSIVFLDRLTKYYCACFIEFYPGRVWPVPGSFNWKMFVWKIFC